MNTEVNKENIISFIANYKDFKYGLTDEVKAAAEEKAEVQEGEL